MIICRSSFSFPSFCFHPFAAPFLSSFSSFPSPSHLSLHHRSSFSLPRSSITSFFFLGRSPCLSFLVPHSSRSHEDKKTFHHALHELRQKVLFVCFSNDFAEEFQRTEFFLSLYFCSFFLRQCWKILPLQFRQIFNTCSF